MSEVLDHYENLLADRYSWMLGDDFAALVEEQQALLESVGVNIEPAGPETAGAVALDLGCGSGLHSAALVKLGFTRVVGVDSSTKLLDEFVRRSAEYPGLEPVSADLSDGVAGIALPGTIHTAVCMGDTLTHLPSIAVIEQLFSDVYGLLKPGGRFVMTFRDLTESLTGLDRFIAVRSDSSRLMTCFVEDTGGDHVVIHDLFHERTINGSWQFAKGCYRKIKIAPEWVERRMVETGFLVPHCRIGPRGMTVLSAYRPE